MPITILLEKDSRPTKPVHAILHWAMDVAMKTVALHNALNKVRAAAAGKPEASPQDPEAVFGMHLAAFGSKQIEALADCVNLISASLKEDPGKTDSSLKATVSGFTESIPGMAEKLAVATRLEPGVYWQRLTDSTQAAGELLARAIEAGRKPLPQPTGIFGKLGRKLSSRDTVAKSGLLHEMELTLSHLAPLQQELRNVIAEMEKS